MSLKIGRLQLGPPSVAAIEPVGDPIGGVGGAVVPAPRVPQQIQLQLNTIVTGATTVAQAQTIRRQLRSMLNNTTLKFQGYLYIAYDDDTELNGWYVPDAGTITSRDATSFKAGVWETDAMNFSLVGHMRTHRSGRQVWMKDLVTGDYQRDTQGWLYSTDFSFYAQNWSRPKLATLPPGVTGVIQSVANQAYPSGLLPSSRDGSQSVQFSAVADLIALVYDWAEGSMNRSDVVVYDRRGQITAPTTGPDTSWEEFYGPDYPYNWLTGGQPNDCPVIDNGLVRVRYDGTNTPGFRVDLWTGSAFSEQGKMIVIRRPGFTSETCDTWVSAHLREYTPDRAVVGVVLRVASDVYSREMVFITVQRGQTGVTFEVYPALQSNGSQSDAQLVWTPAGGPDANDSIFKSDDQNSPIGPGSGKLVATAGSGSALFSNSTVGAADFSSSENLVTYLRFISSVATIGPYQHNFAVLQGANASARSDSGTFGTLAYGGSTRNDLVIRSQNGAGYLSAQISFAPTTSDQASEAETIRNASSGTTSQVSDANASSGIAVEDTQTTNTAVTLKKTSTNLLQATYRIMLRIRAGSTGSAFAQAALGATAGVAMLVPLTTSYQWVDLGDILAPSANPQLTISTWSGVSAVLPPPTGLQVQKTPVYPWGGFSITYFYHVTALNINGETTGSNQATTNPHPTTGGKQMLLTWNAVPGASSYNVYVTSSGQAGSTSFIGNTAATSFVDTGGTGSAGVVPTTNTATVPAAAPLFLDRYEAILMEDHVRGGSYFIGARDQALAALFDARVIGCLAAR